MTDKVFSVSAVNRYIKGLMANDYALKNIYVKGEVSNCKYSSPGHIYFTLKDKASAMSCIMFAGNRGGLSFKLEEGMSVIVLGYIGVYERDGKYQLYASEIVMDGRGALYEEYERLKKKLLAEGLFDEGHKKPLPPYPRSIGVVTAATGAAVQDIINVSLRRNPWMQIVFCRAKVQGEGAAESVIRGIKALDSYGVDLMIVGRGGGSIEDLWAFNDEALARAVYECATPIVSAVGHETDTTIIDYVSDLRAPTPSAAAELAVPDINLVIRRIDDYGELLRARLRDNIQEKRARLKLMELRLKSQDPIQIMLDSRQRLMQLQERMNALMDTKTERAGTNVRLYAQRLSDLSPLKQLERGYAYVSDEEGKGISSIGQVSEGSGINISLKDGDMSAVVTGIRAKTR